MPTFKPKYGSNGTFYDGDILVTILECRFFGEGFFQRVKIQCTKKRPEDFIRSSYSPWSHVKCKTQERVLGGHFQTQAVLVFCHCQHWWHQQRVMRGIQYLGKKRLSNMTGALSLLAIQYPYSANRLHYFEMHSSTTQNTNTGAGQRQKAKAFDQPTM